MKPRITSSPSFSKLLENLVCTFLVLLILTFSDVFVLVDAAVTVVNVDKGATVTIENEIYSDRGLEIRNGVGSSHLEECTIIIRNVRTQTIRFSDQVRSCSITIENVTCYYNTAYAGCVNFLQSITLSSTNQERNVIYIDGLTYSQQTHRSPRAIDHASHVYYVKNYTVRNVNVNTRRCCSSTSEFNGGFFWLQTSKTFQYVDFLLIENVFQTTYVKMANNHANSYFVKLPNTVQDVGSIIIRNITWNSHVSAYWNVNNYFFYASSTFRRVHNVIFDGISADLHSNSSWYQQNNYLVSLERPANIYHSFIIRNIYGFNVTAIGDATLLTTHKGATHLLHFNKNVEHFPPIVIENVVSNALLQTRYQNLYVMVFFADKIKNISSITMTNISAQGSVVCTNTNADYDSTSKAVAQVIRFEKSVNENLGATQRLNIINVSNVNFGPWFVSTARNSADVSCLKFMQRVYDVQLIHLDNVHFIDINIQKARDQAYSSLVTFVDQLSNTHRIELDQCSSTVIHMRSTISHTESALVRFASAVSNFYEGLVVTNSHISCAGQRPYSFLSKIARCHVVYFASTLTSSTDIGIFIENISSSITVGNVGATIPRFHHSILMLNGAVSSVRRIIVNNVFVNVNSMRLFTYSYLMLVSFGESSSVSYTQYIDEFAVTNFNISVNDVHRTATTSYFYLYVVYQPRRFRHCQTVHVENITFHQLDVTVRNGMYVNVWRALQYYRQNISQTIMRGVYYNNVTLSATAGYVYFTCWYSSTVIGGSGIYGVGNFTFENIFMGYDREKNDDNNNNNNNPVRLVTASTTTIFRIIYCSSTVYYTQGWRVYNCHMNIQIDYVSSSVQVDMAYFSTIQYISSGGLQFENISLTSNVKRVTSAQLIYLLRFTSSIINVAGKISLNNFLLNSTGFMNSYSWTWIMYASSTISNITNGIHLLNGKIDVPSQVSASSYFQGGIFYCPSTIQQLGSLNGNPTSNINQVDGGFVLKNIDLDVNITSQSSYIQLFGVFLAHFINSDRLLVDNVNFNSVRLDSYQSYASVYLVQVYYRLVNIYYGVAIKNSGIGNTNTNNNDGGGSDDNNIVSVTCQKNKVEVFLFRFVSVSSYLSENIGQKIADIYPASTSIEDLPAGILIENTTIKISRIKAGLSKIYVFTLSVMQGGGTQLQNIGGSGLMMNMTKVFVNNAENLGSLGSGRQILVYGAVFDKKIITATNFFFYNNHVEVNNSRARDSVYVHVVDFASSIEDVTEEIRFENNSLNVDNVSSLSNLVSARGAVFKKNIDAVSNLKLLVAQGTKIFAQNFQAGGGTVSIYSLYLTSVTDVDRVALHQIDIVGENVTGTGSSGAVYVNVLTIAGKVKDVAERFSIYRCSVSGSFRSLENVVQCRIFSHFDKNLVNIGLSKNSKGILSWRSSGVKFQKLHLNVTVTADTNNVETSLIYIEKGIHDCTQLLLSNCVLTVNSVSKGSLQVYALYVGTYGTPVADKSIKDVSSVVVSDIVSEITSHSTNSVIVVALTDITGNVTNISSDYVNAGTTPNSIADPPRKYYDNEGHLIGGLFVRNISLNCVNITSKLWSGLHVMRFGRHITDISSLRMIDINFVGGVIKSQLDSAAVRLMMMNDGSSIYSTIPAGEQDSNGGTMTSASNIYLTFENIVAQVHTIEGTFTSVTIGYLPTISNISTFSAKNVTVNITNSATTTGTSASTHNYVGTFRHPSSAGAFLSVSNVVKYEDMTVVVASASSVDTAPIYIMNLQFAGKFDDVTNVEIRDLNVHAFNIDGSTASAINVIGAVFYEDVTNVNNFLISGGVLESTQLSSNVTSQMYFVYFVKNIENILLSFTVSDLHMKNLVGKSDFSFNQIFLFNAVGGAGNVIRNISSFVVERCSITDSKFSSNNTLLYSNIKISSIVNVFTTNPSFINVSSIRLSSLKISNVQQLKQNDNGIRKTLIANLAAFSGNITNVSTLVFENSVISGMFLTTNMYDSARAHMLRFNSWIFPKKFVLDDPNDNTGIAAAERETVSIVVRNNSFLFDNEQNKQYQTAQGIAVNDGNFGTNLDTIIGVVELRRSLDLAAMPATEDTGYGNTIDVRYGKLNLNFTNNILEIPYRFKGNASVIHFAGEDFAGSSNSWSQLKLPTAFPVRPKLLLDQNSLRLADVSSSSDLFPNAAACTVATCSVLSLYPRLTLTTTPQPNMKIAFYQNFSLTNNFVGRGLTADLVAFNDVNASSTSDSYWYLKGNRMDNRDGTIFYFSVLNQGKSMEESTTVANVNQVANFNNATIVFECANYWSYSFERLFLRDFSKTAQVTFKNCPEMRRQTISMTESSTENITETYTTPVTRTRSATNTTTLSMSRNTETVSANVTASLNETASSSLTKNDTSTSTKTETARTLSLTEHINSSTAEATTTQTFSATFSHNGSSTMNETSITVEPTRTRTKSNTVIPPPIMEVAEVAEAVVAAASTSASVGSAAGSPVAVRSLSVLALGVRMCGDDGVTAAPPPKLWFPQSVMPDLWIGGEYTAESAIWNNKTFLDAMPMDKKRDFIITHRALPQHRAAAVANTFLFPPFIVFCFWLGYTALAWWQKKSMYPVTVMKQGNVLGRSVQALAFSCEGCFASSIFLMIELRSSVGDRILGVFIFFFTLACFILAFRTVSKRFRRHRMEFVAAAIKHKKKDAKLLTPFWKFVLGDGLWTENDQDRQIEKRDKKKQQQENNNNNSNNDDEEIDLSAELLLSPAASEEVSSPTLAESMNRTQNENDNENDGENNVENENEETDAARGVSGNTFSSNSSCTSGFSKMLFPLYKKFGVIEPTEVKEKGVPPSMLLKLRMKFVPFFFFIDVFFTLWLAVIRGVSVAAPCQFKVLMGAAVVGTFLSLLLILLLRPLHSNMRLLFETLGTLLVFIATLTLVGGVRNADALIVTGVSVSGFGLMSATLLSEYKTKARRYLLVPKKEAMRQTVLVDLMENLRAQDDNNNNGEGDADNDLSLDVMAFLNAAPSSNLQQSENNNNIDDIVIDMENLELEGADEDIELEELPVVEENDEEEEYEDEEYFSADEMWELDDVEQQEEEPEEDDEGGEQASTTERQKHIEQEEAAARIAEEKEKVAEEKVKEKEREKNIAAIRGSPEYQGDQKARDRRLLDQLELEVDDDDNDNASGKSKAKSKPKRQQAVIENAKQLQSLLKNMAETL